MLALPPLLSLSEEEKEEAESVVYQAELYKAEQLELTLSYFDLDEDLSGNEDEEDESGLLKDLPDEDDESFNAADEDFEDDKSSQNGGTYTFKFPGNNPLLSGCRIVYSFQANKPIVNYRSFNGQYFKSKEELVSHIKSQYPDRVDKSQVTRDSVSESSSHLDNVTIQVPENQTRKKPARAGSLSESDSKKSLTGHEGTNTSQNRQTSNLKPKLVSQQHTQSMLTEQIEGPTRPEDPDIQGIVNPGKNKPIPCPECKVEVPRKTITKHLMTHQTQANKPVGNIDKKTKTPRGKKTRNVEEAILNFEHVKKQEKQKETSPDVSTNKTPVSQDQDTPLLPILGASSFHMEKMNKRESGPVKTKRSRSINSLEGAAKKSCKGKPGQGTLSAETTEIGKRGRKESKKEKEDVEP